MLDEIKVVNRIPEADETKALFASRGANGKLLIHRGLMDYMLKHVNEENEYFLMLDQYASTLLDLRNYPEFDGLTKDGEVQNWCLRGLLLWSSVRQGHTVLPIDINRHSVTAYAMTRTSVIISNVTSTFIFQALRILPGSIIAAIAWMLISRWRRCVMSNILQSGF